MPEHVLAKKRLEQIATGGIADKLTFEERKRQREEFGRKALAPGGRKRLFCV